MAVCAPPPLIPSCSLLLTSSHAMTMPPLSESESPAQTAVPPNALRADRVAQIVLNRPPGEFMPATGLRQWCADLRTDVIVHPENGQLHMSRDAAFKLVKAFCRKNKLDQQRQQAIEQLLEENIMVNEGLYELQKTPMPQEPAAHQQTPTPRIELARKRRASPAVNDSSIMATVRMQGKTIAAQLYLQRISELRDAYSEASEEDKAAALADFEQAFQTFEKYSKE